MTYEGRSSQPLYCNAIKVRIIADERMPYRQAKARCGNTGPIAMLCEKNDTVKIWPLQVSTSPFYN